MKFEDFTFSYEVLDGVHALGFEDATPIQEQVIPAVLEGKDILACAQTGTGKTAAYLLPMLERLMDNPVKHIQALVIVPTRELANQVDENMEALGYFTGVSSIAIYGGGNAAGWDRQKIALTTGVNMVIATPGRFLLHLSMGYIDLSKVEMVVLDEADKMLDMGFYSDIIRVFNHLPSERQTIMVSATMPGKIKQLAKKILNNPFQVNLNLSKPAEGVDQTAYSVYNDQKIPLLCHLIETTEVDSMIIFASSKRSVDEITRKLNARKIKAKSVHSDKEQQERELTLREFKNKQLSIVVATDVLSRGIDIDNLSHVLNFDVPRDVEDYVHRVGRTARAASTGSAITFISPDDQRRFARIEKMIEKTVPKPEVPEELGETPEYKPTPFRGKNKRKGNNKRKNYKSGNKSQNSGSNKPKNRRNDDSSGKDQSSRGDQKKTVGEGGPKRRNRRRPNKQSGNSNNRNAGRKHTGDKPDTPPPNS